MKLTIKLTHSPPFWGFFGTFFPSIVRCKKIGVVFFRANKDRWIFFTSLRCAVRLLGVHRFLPPVPWLSTRWRFQICLFSPLFGKDSHFDEHIFHMGWFNHQLVKDCFSFFGLNLPEKLWGFVDWAGGGFIMFGSWFCWQNMWSNLFGGWWFNFWFWIEIMRI